MLALIGCWVLASCATLGNRPASFIKEGVVIVERSKEHPPAWIELKPGHFHESDKLFRYIERRDKLLNLPLGIKQVQLGALTGSERALTGIIMERINEHAMLKGVSMISSPARTELGRIVAGAAKSAHTQHARVADIYFEKLQLQTAVVGDHTGYYYRVQVLVQFPRSTLPQTFKEIGAEILKSRDKDLRQLAATVTDLFKGEITH